MLSCSGYLTRYYTLTHSESVPSKYCSNILILAETKIKTGRAEYTGDDGSDLNDYAAVYSLWKSQGFHIGLKFTSCLGHFGAGFSVEGSADESSGIHQL